MRRIRYYLYAAYATYTPGSEGGNAICLCGGEVGVRGGGGGEGRDMRLSGGQPDERYVCDVYVAYTGGGEGRDSRGGGEGRDMGRGARGEGRHAPRVTPSPLGVRSRGRGARGVTCRPARQHHAALS
jgi:hypothetical protein